MQENSSRGVPNSLDLPAWSLSPTSTEVGDTAFFIAFKRLHYFVTNLRVTNGVTNIFIGKMKSRSIPFFRA